MAATEQNGATGADMGERRSTARRLRGPLMIIAPVVILAAAAYAYLTSGRYQSTDDAYVNASRVSISSNIPGRVIELDVRENQPVKAGQVLFRLDPRDYQAAVTSAQAELARARLQVRSTQASYDPRAAELSAARADLAYKQKELTRQRALTGAGVGSQRELDQRADDVTVAQGRVRTAEAAVRQALATIGGPANGPVDANPTVQAAQAALDRAELNLSYTTVRAPQDGRAAHVEQLQVGNYITPAQPLFFLLAPRMWIDANFKENQLTYMRVGQHGEAKIDAFPGRKIPVHVESLSPGTGAAFSILPPENATGNWVKVTQRLPVRIAFDRPQDLGELLHAGLSADVKIDTEHRKSLLGGSPPPRPAP